MLEVEDVIRTLKKIPEQHLEHFAHELFLSYHKRIWIIGNGGSASTASHFAADLASIGFDVVCLTDNISRVTAVTNDYGWHEVYTKQLQHLKQDDVLIAISVHGGSERWSNNLTLAVKFAKNKRAKVLSLTGHDGGQLAKMSYSLIVLSDSTPIIEGIHCVLTHIIRQKLEVMKNASNNA